MVKGSLARQAEFGENLFWPASFHEATGSLPEPDLVEPFLWGLIEVLSEAPFELAQGNLEQSSKFDRPVVCDLGKVQPVCLCAKPAIQVVFHLISPCPEGTARRLHVESLPSEHRLKAISRAVRRPDFIAAFLVIPQLGPAVVAE
jgi:hypothetical protein